MLQVVVDVDEAKKQEFLLALKSFAKMSHFDESDRYSLYQRLGSENTFCDLCYLDTKNEMDAYLQSNLFQYFLGAVKVLCTKVDSKVLQIDQTEMIKQFQ